MNESKKVGSLFSVILSTLSLLSGFPTIFHVIFTDAFTLVKLLPAFLRGHMRST